MSRTIALQPGPEGEETSLRIHAQDAEAGAGERDWGGASGPPSSDGFKVPAAPGPKKRGKCIGDTSKEDRRKQITQQLREKNDNNHKGEALKTTKKKKKILNMFFKSGKDKRPQSNKENLEMIPSEEDGCGFSRYNPRSRSFGADGSSGHCPQPPVTGQRFGSCRMSQAWRGDPATTHRAGGSNSVRKMHLQNSSNQLLTSSNQHPQTSSNQHPQTSSEESDDKSSPRTQVEMILRQLEDGHA